MRISKTKLRLEQKQSLDGEGMSGGMTDLRGDNKDGLEKKMNLEFCSTEIWAFRVELSWLCRK